MHMTVDQKRRMRVKVSEKVDSDVSVLRVNDKGSKPQFADVLIQGVPTTDIIDIGANITIIGGELFQKVAAAVRMKRDFKRADKVP